MKTICQRDIGIYASYSTIHNNPENGSHVSNSPWIKRVWYKHTMEYYSTVEKDEILTFETTWMELEAVTLSGSAKQKKNHVISSKCKAWKTVLLWNLKMQWWLPKAGEGCGEGRMRKNWLTGTKVLLQSKATLGMLMYYIFLCYLKIKKKTFWIFSW